MQGLTSHVPGEAALTYVPLASTSFPGSLGVILAEYVFGAGCWTWPHNTQVSTADIGGGASGRPICVSCPREFLRPARWQRGLNFS